MKNDTLKIYMPALLLALLGFIIAFQFIDPAPPKTLTFSAGQPGGAYNTYAERYKVYLEKRGIQVNILASAGSLENIDRLKKGVADIAFVQSGIAELDDALLSLGSMYYEPLWIFLRHDLDIQFLRDLKGKRLAIGMPGSGTRALSMQLLQENGIDKNTTTLQGLPSSEAAKALIDGELDAVFLVTGSSSKVIQRLKHNPHVYLMPIVRTHAYIRRMNAITSVSLPQGALNLGLNIPTADTPLLASTATLMTSANMHPALQALIMQAASEIHHQRSIFADAGAFPSPQHFNIPLSTVAASFYKSGPPFLQRYLPFWAAALANRLKVMLLPFLVLLLPLMKIMPPLYRWRIRSRTYRWYDELNRIDIALADGFDQGLLEDLERMEADIRKMRVPLPYANELYNLRMHVVMIRKQAEQSSA